MDNGRQVSSDEESLRIHAYAIWESEGRPAGRHIEHWRQAEIELGRAAQASPSSRNLAPQSDARRGEPKSRNER